MNIGTAEILDDIEPPKKRRASTIGGSGGGNGSRRNPGGGGSDGPEDEKTDDRDTFTRAKSRILTIFLLIIVTMTFGGLIAAYVVIATNRVVEWQPFDLPRVVFLSTFLIIASSITYYFSERSTIKNDHASAQRWLMATTTLGVAFIMSQTVVWLDLNSRGFYMRGNPYGGFFYILTAIHAVHVLGGITALGSLLYRTRRPAAGEVELADRITLTHSTGWYWHFMGMLWIVLFILLGFWK